jgi:nicotinate-nucleotide adenylyltransferase
MAKIGLLGGTFNPPHLGHLIVAEDVLVKQQLDEIWFMPCSQPPHKETFVSAAHRVEMVKLAIGNNRSFKLCTIELELEGPSYTAITMKELKSQYPEHSFSFIIGGDSVETLHQWYNIDELLQYVSFIAVNRPGYQLNSPYIDQITEVETPLIEISSTGIRQRIKEKLNVTYLLPESVLKYIKENQLYG